MGGHNLTCPFPHALQIELARSSASRQPSISRTRRRHHQKPEPLLHLTKRSCGWRALIELAHFLLRTVQLVLSFHFGQETLITHTFARRRLYLRKRLRKRGECERGDRSDGGRHAGRGRRRRRGRGGRLAHERGVRNGSSDSGLVSDE